MTVISVHILLPIVKLSINRKLIEKFLFYFKEGNTNDFVESSMFI